MPSDWTKHTFITYCTEYMYSICSRPTIWKNAHIHLRRCDTRSNTITINPLNMIRLCSINKILECVRNGLPSKKFPSSNPDSAQPIYRMEMNLRIQFGYAAASPADRWITRSIYCVAHWWLPKRSHISISATVRIIHWCRIYPVGYCCKSKLATTIGEHEYGYAKNRLERDAGEEKGSGWSLESGKMQWNHHWCNLKTRCTNFDEATRLGNHSSSPNFTHEAHSAVIIFTDERNAVHIMRIKCQLLHSPSVWRINVFALDWDGY